MDYETASSHVKFVNSFTML